MTQAAKGTVPAVARAMRLLEVVAAAERPLSLVALQASLSLPKSTLHGLCSTLVQGGLLTRFEDGSYHLGLRVMDLAHAFVARTDLTTDFVKAWESIALLPEETIMLSVLDGADVVYIACRNGTRPLGLNFRIGMRLPASCTASGKSMLSTLPREQVAALLRASSFRTLTRRSVRTPTALGRQLEQARRRGFAVDEEETRTGMVCLGAPVFDAPGGAAVAGVAVSLLKAEATRAKKALAAEAVLRLASLLSSRLGARAEAGRQPRPAR